MARVRFAEAAGGSDITPFPQDTTSSRLSRTAEKGLPPSLSPTLELGASFTLDEAASSGAPSNVLQLSWERA